MALPTYVYCDGDDGDDGEGGRRLGEGRPEFESIWTGQIPTERDLH